MKMTILIALVRLAIKVAQLWVDKQVTVAPFELDPEEGAAVAAIEEAASKVDALAAKR